MLLCVLHKWLLLRPGSGPAGVSAVLLSLLLHSVEFQVNKYNISGRAAGKTVQNMENFPEFDLEN